MKKTGILYDNISGNTGDVAIGLSLKKILRQLNVPFDELVPGNFNPLDYETIIIGGGHLIRPSPDFYYDKFRVPGNHILNAMGIVGEPEDLDYLKKYRYITVRSNGDRKKLAYLNLDVHVIPCTSMLLEDLPDYPFTPKKPCIGIHLFQIFTSPQEEDNFVRWASSLPFTIYFIPITHYNRDIDYMRKLQGKISNAELLPILSVQEIFTVIGRFNYFISCSMHGAIFAYCHNVPFVLYNSSDKMQFFMEDRGLEDFLFTNDKEMIGSFDDLVKRQPDYSEKILSDKKVLRDYQEILKTLLPAGTETPAENNEPIPQSRHQIIALLQDVSRLAMKNSGPEEKDPPLELKSAETRIAELQQAVDNLNKIIGVRDQQIAKLTGTITSIRQENESLKRSVTYKVTTRFHRTVVDRLFRPNSRRRRYYDLGLEGGRVLVNEGWRSLWGKWRKEFSRSDGGNTRIQQYARWIEINEAGYQDIGKIRNDIASFGTSPKISIVVPVWDVDKKWLISMIESVINQTYQNWELCIVDADSKKTHIKKILTEYQNRDPRIKIKYLGKNGGISENTNEAITLANGDYIGFLDHDDELAPFALYEVVKYINSHPEANLIYSDEDKIYETGHRSEPFFKPDWAPDHFLSQNYICHFCVIKREMLARTGGLRKEFDGSQDYDLLLRLTEILRDSEIGHIPKVLYHWRVLPSSTSYNVLAKPAVISSSTKAIQEAVNRRGIPAGVSEGITRDTYRVKYVIQGTPLISIIIPTRDHGKDLTRCVQSVLAKTTYDNYEILIVNNNSEDPETYRIFTDLKKDRRIQIINYDKEFNFSCINNFAAGHAKGEFLLFLNNDTEVIRNEWLAAMLEHAQRKEIGAVGAKLLYPDNTIQHAGVVLGIGPPGSAVAGHSHKYLPARSPGYFSSLNLIRNYSAVTAACLMIRKEVFLDVGGFDENLGIAFNDVDLCMKIRKAGYFIVYTPFAELYHTESKSRGYEDTPEKVKRFQTEITYFRSRWGTVIDRGDPFYNRNLSHRKEDFSLNTQD
jgi:GT2 family glycosyltransferase